MTAIKVVFWDVDGTLATGVVGEDRDTAVRPELDKLIRASDEHGVLHGLVSRGDTRAIAALLERADLAEHFVISRIVPDAAMSKAELVTDALTQLGYAATTAVFVDDTASERAEVLDALPGITVIDWRDAAELLAGPRGPHGEPTPESRHRRERVHAQLLRDADLTRYVITGGSRIEFLRRSGLHMTIRPIAAGDLDRLADLTDRASQLKATGTIYSRRDLETLSRRAGHQVVVADLLDNYANYGTVGLAVLSTSAHGQWGRRLAMLEFLIMSCTVLSSGAGPVFLAAIKAKLAATGMPRLYGAYVPTDRNEPMWRAYGAIGFTLANGTRPPFAELRRGMRLDLVADLAAGQPLPDYVAFTDRWTPDGLPSLEATR